MRNIEDAMLKAVHEERNWSRDNARAEVGAYGPRIVTTVYLHGNRIAWNDPVDGWTVDLETFRDWPTVTTVSRLRALGFEAQRKNNQAYLNGKPA